MVLYGQDSKLNRIHAGFDQWLNKAFLPVGSRNRQPVAKLLTC